MDAIELARQKAASVHQQGVEKGDDPTAPYAFVVAQAERHGLTVCPVPDSMLDGALARLDADAGCIIHTRSGSEFEQAIYVAHELGHALLGDAAPAGACEIDPFRPAEAAPVGEERVIDYGRRQRREVQMDLFARELILPRPVVRRLHVDEGRTATEIAGMFAAPFAVAAQQLLDALLLPPIQPEPEGPARSPAKPDASQIAAAGHRGGPALVEAGPGTGKTQTLVKRIVDLLNEGADPRGFLVLTFSNKAAGELADRIAARDPEAAAAMWIGTFHAFGRDLVQRHFGRLGFDREPRLMDRVEAIELLEPESARLGLRHYKDIRNPASKLSDILAAISRAQDELVDPAEYLALAQAMEGAAGEDATARIAAEKAVEVARVYARYQQIKRDRRAIDFGDLITLPVALLREDPEAEIGLRALYRHILVDEYQDVNHASVELLKRLSPTGRNLWVVGDVRQSIYRFRGASPFNVDRFGSADFGAGTRLPLAVNYRSSEEIVQAFSAFATGMSAGAGRPAALKAERGPSGHPVEHRRFLDNDGEAAALADAIGELKAAGFALRDQAILCSGNDRLARLGSELERRGVPVLYLGSLFERPEIQDLLSWLTLLTDPRAMGLVRETPLSAGLSLADVQAAMTALRTRNRDPLDWTDALAVVSPEGRAALERLRAALNGFSAEDHPWTVLASVLLDRTRVVADIASSVAPEAKARGVAIWQFLNFVRVQPGGGARGPVRRLLDRIRRLVALADDRDLRQLPAAAQVIDAVRLMTMHGSKGLEFPVVHLPGLNHEALPRSFRTKPCPPPDGLIGRLDTPAGPLLRSAHDDEQECLFYVALSRARDRLFIYSARQNKASAGRKAAERAVSAFVGRATRSPERWLTDPAAPDRRPEDLPVAVVSSERPAFALHELALYEKCPRQFLYSVLLAIGGNGGTRPAFLTMHDVVRDVLSHVIRDGGPGRADRLLDAALEASGLAGDDYGSDFRQIAAELVEAFVESRQGRSGRSGERLVAALDRADIHVQPDEVLDGAGGPVFRRVRTGHYSKTSATAKAEAVFPLVIDAVSPGAAMEVVYLGDGRVETVSGLAPKDVGKRRDAINAFVADILDGRFPTRESAFTCPNCPAFFVCGPIAAGSLKI
ncbi:ATP-dependent helicase [Brevundimonas naejangsanensis]|uniref:ATP-dependent helicase n=1 Tax=Brevundimonas naejangsanensis TaxID=588932 RepID=UPI003D05D698